jgi:hypothetical protein
MRYLVAMVFAFAGAILATMFLGTPVANFVVDHLSFESPDDADNLHMLTFVGTLQPTQTRRLTVAVPRPRQPRLPAGAICRDGAPSALGRRTPIG